MTVGGEAQDSQSGNREIDESAHTTRSSEETLTDIDAPGTIKGNEGPMKGDKPQPSELRASLPRAIKLI
jgi:hypothetical protein